LGAIALTVTPWLVHNFLASGILTFDAPFQYRIVASQYRYAGNLDIENPALQGAGLAGMILGFAIRNPLFVLGFVSNHFLATQIGGLLALPLCEPYNGLRADLNLYWLGWDGRLAGGNLALVIGYLVLIAIGLGVAWRHFRWSGLVPLVFSLGYSLANGLGRFSGWRYDLPADWVSYFYLCLGGAEIMSAAALLLGAAQSRILTSKPAPLVRQVHPTLALLPILGFVLLGFVPWMAEGIAHPRFAGLSVGELTQKLSTAPKIRDLGITAMQLEEFVNSRGATIEVGRTLYPRFFTRNTGLTSAHPWPAYSPRDFPRVGFLLLNQIRHDVVLPIRQPQEAFLHASDAIVLGCQRPDHIEARLVLFVDSGVAYAGAPLSEPCP
jgi:hypothetical protein